MALHLLHLGRGERLNVMDAGVLFARRDLWVAIALRVHPAGQAEHPLGTELHIHLTALATL
jgi:hypothetical protein